ncbi:quinone oxidoreductase [Candidatus Sodalis sp. SoCistrobi]|uniref:quinone oxidoreductase n=1 Tax=Candidatus Sodalis sp. SoCistrobi TaxID=1922216 RepID=UPI00093A13E4|nr:quinone oxidoreductase [Candidatus Sodalis sp. SoCistrobi]
MAKRIQFAAHGGPEVMEYVDFTPPDPGPGEVQVENKAIGINYIDTYVRSGLYPPPSLPSGLGTEAAGVVGKVGPGVEHLQPGDRVVYAQSPLGAYATVHNVPADKLAQLPNAISFEQAAAAFLKGLTVFYLLRQTYEIKPNEIFLFHAAAGGVGRIACQWSKALGAKMIGTVGSAEKAALAKQAGAWETINYREENVPERVAALTDGNKVNVVYDSVGKHTWEASLDCLRRRGLMVSFGNSSGPVTGVNLGILNQKGSLFVTRPSINGYITDGASLKHAADELFSMIASGVIKVDVPAEQKFTLSEVQRAHQALEHRQTNGSLLLIP